MPSLTPAELSKARRSSGRLGGRPRKPTVTEARQVKLEKLVPEALHVLERNLKSENENMRQRVAEHVLDRAWGRPTQPTVDETESAVRAEIAILRDDLRFLTDEDPPARS